MSETIKGYVSNVIFHNEENGYSVLQLEVEHEGEVTLVGNLMEVHTGEYLEAEGSYVDHPSYGIQFKFSAAKIRVPDGGEALLRYLSSGAVKGIGKALAKRIIAKFGEDTLRIMEEEPERLSEIRGISEKKAVKIGSEIQERQEMQNAMLFLSQYGISLRMGARIYEKYQNMLYKVLARNPYQLAEDIQGIGFTIADEIAAKTGFEKDSPFRIQSGILYTLSQAAQQGHCYLPEEVLLREASRLLGTAKEQVQDQLLGLFIDKKLYLQKDEEMRKIYSQQMYFLELSLARMLIERNVRTEEDPDKILQGLQRMEKDTTLKLDDLQKEAVLSAATHAIMILTGGPGTGKTTTINSMIRYFQLTNQKILLAAPTGRAARRMKETTGYEASTIHRLLEISGGVHEERPDALPHFERNEENPLDADVVIIDEMSMVDLYLMHALIRAIKIGTRVIFVGDQNQLPSVGPGSILRDLIKSEAFPVIYLTHIFRQAKRSDIVVNAHKINNGEEISLDNASRDFFFIHATEVVNVQKILAALVAKRLPPYVHTRSRDIQVLTPMRKTPLGVIALNQLLQNYLNPGGKGKREKDTPHGLFREGDKVMQIKNNYQLPWEIREKNGILIEEGMGIFNGDIGILKRIDREDESVLVEFEEGREVTYSYSQLEELELAYATTIHKAQGSEYPAVVIPLLGGPRLLMTRNLLYTAVTRAEACVVLVGSEETFRQMIRNKREENRYTSLAERIGDLMNGIGGIDLPDTSRETGENDRMER